MGGAVVTDNGWKTLTRTKLSSPILIPTKSKRDVKRRKSRDYNLANPFLVCNSRYKVILKTYRELKVSRRFGRCRLERGAFVASSGAASVGPPAGEGGDVTSGDDVVQRSAAACDDGDAAGQGRRLPSQERRHDWSRSCNSVGGWFEAPTAARELSGDGQSGVELLKCAG
ncbi:hypothetical protein AAHA92_09965 [Salvia divinorum]|uniref:Uncharacterized protein n=1 Tax=Salvia divinorum TaxID=28513 RepID=A0ABD1HTV0_SALDI